MKAKDIYWFVNNCCDSAERHANLAKEGKDSRTLDYWLGYLLGIESAMVQMFWYADYEDIKNEYGIQRFENKTEAEKYAYDEQWEATGYDEALNKVYRDSGLTTEIVVKGNTYFTHHVPFGFMKVEDNIYPIFDDDAGQCEYIRIAGEDFSGGAYNFEPEEFFLAKILDERLYDTEEKIKKIYLKGE